MDKPYRDMGWLQEHYCEQGLTLKECAKLARCHFATICRQLEKFGIPRRTISDTTKAAWTRGVFDNRYTEEVRQKMSDAIRTAWKQGVYDSEETRQKMGDASKASWAHGDYDSEETHRKMSEATRASWKRGDRDSEETRQKMGEAIRASWERGDYDSEETRQKMSDATRASHACGAYSSKETRQKVREGLEAVHAQGAYSSKETRQKVREGLEAAHARGCYDGVFQSPTSIEIAISEALDRLGIEHIKQFRPDGCSYIYDEFIPPNILLEVNGNYWHGRPGVPEKDARKEAWATEYGFLPVAIWESEIKKYGALAMIQKRCTDLDTVVKETSA